MLAYLEGKITLLEPAFAHIDIQGIGYETKISLNTYTQLKGKTQAKLFTFLHIKEDAHTLYGFFELSEKKLFLDLLSVTGIGPNIALTMLSSMHMSELHQAILAENVRLIQSIKGIGTKTAQRVILELKDKLKKDTNISISQNDTLTSHNNSVRIEALSALTTLGIPKQVAEKTIDTILRSHDANLTTEDLIKLALKSA